jgi:hypothetical protein
LRSFPLICDHFRSFAVISDQLRSFPLICGDFRSFPMILAIYLVPRGTAEVLQFGKTIAEDTSMSGYQKREAASAYRFGPTSVRQFRDIMIAAQAHNRC